MVRTMFVFICFILQISISKAGWSSRLFPCTSGSFRTISSSPSNGPFFISAKPCLMVTQNLNYVPIILGPDENCTQQQDINELIVQEITEIEEQDIKIDEEKSTTDIETVLVDENEGKIGETLFSNDPVNFQDNLEYTENLEESEIKNTPPIVDSISSLDLHLSSLDCNLSIRYK